jgi:hypothetical protein
MLTVFASLTSDLTISCAWSACLLTAVVPALAGALGALKSASQGVPFVNAIITPLEAFLKRVRAAVQSIMSSRTVEAFWCRSRQQLHRQLSCPSPYIVRWQVPSRVAHCRRVRTDLCPRTEASYRITNRLSRRARICKVTLLAWVLTCCQQPLRCRQVGLACHNVCDAALMVVLHVEAVRVNKAMAQSMKRRVDALMEFLLVSAWQLLSACRQKVVCDTLCTMCVVHDRC